ncbi:hypothetical protein IW152_005064 [Coemansia sp. BCRC 34962]|nr:hypothetical protein IW152_005064 [Coemansia sp. BCRC 34962]
MNETLLFSYHDIAVYSGDPMSLREGQWLNDAMLSFYYEYLTHEILRGDNSILLLKPTLVQCLRLQQDAKSLRSALPTDMHTKELIFIPVNNSNNLVHVEGGSGSHWSLLVYVKHANPTYHYYDSMANMNYQYALAVKSKLDAILLGTAGPVPPMITHSCPQQENGSDCGIFVILFTDLLSRRYNDLRLPPPPVSPERPRRLSADPDAARRAAYIALQNRRNSAQLQSLLPRRHPSALSDAKYDSSGVVRRPMSPFVSGSAREGVGVRPAMMVASVADRTFWWIDYSDLCNPLKARTTLQALVNDHCVRYSNGGPAPFI